MTVIWTAIAAAAVVSFVIKALGPAVVADRQLPAWSRGVIALIAPALLAALIVVDVLGPHWSALNGPVVAGLAATAVAKFLRAPMLLAVVVGIVVTALVRLAVG
jgi:branched-subunit amino acid transport protein